MSTVSPPTAVRQYELWIFLPNGQHGPVPECGLFDALSFAEQAAAAVRNWFHHGSWAEFLYQIPEDTQDELHVTRRGLWAEGRDLKAVVVEARPVVEAWTDHGPARVVYDPDADQDRVDTELEDTQLDPDPVAVRYRMERDDPRDDTR